MHDPPYAAEYCRLSSLMRAQLGRAAQTATRWRVELLDLVFPLRCVGCRRPGHALCPECLARIPLLETPFCPDCLSPMPYPGTACRCRPRAPSLDCLTSASWHEGTARAAVHALKYDHRKELAQPLATLLEQCLGCIPLAFDEITAVPLHPAREHERGYTQAELIARALADRTGRHYATGLQRIRATADQVGLNATERHANVRGAFQADPISFRQQRILLIDDVCTTGATLKACAAALRAQGARAVYGLTVTRPGKAPAPSSEGSYHR